MKPKSIARDMYEECASFNMYVKEYGLARAEGVLLRYLSDCYRAMRQTVPETAKTEQVRDIEEWLGAELRRVDASLIHEWEQLESGEPLELAEESEEEQGSDITRNPREFKALVRRSIFRTVQMLSSKRYPALIDTLSAFAESEGKVPTDAENLAWTQARLGECLEGYWLEYDAMLIDGDARSVKRLSIEESPTQWTVRQTLSDPEENFDWALLFRVDLAESRAQNRAVIQLELIAQG